MAVALASACAAFAQAPARPEPPRQAAQRAAAAPKMLGMPLDSTCAQVRRSLVSAGFKERAATRDGRAAAYEPGQVRVPAFASVTDAKVECDADGQATQVVLSMGGSTDVSKLADASRLSAESGWRRMIFSQGGKNTTVVYQRTALPPGR
jgi:hypothetical protein